MGTPRIRLLTIPIALLIGLAPVNGSEAAKRKKPTQSKSSATKRLAAARPCGSDSIPAKLGDEPVILRDVDSDGNVDALVASKNFSTRQAEMRVSFGGGPEGVVPIGKFGYTTDIEVSRFKLDPNVFILWTFDRGESSGSLFRRQGCELSIPELPSSSPFLYSTSNTPMGIYNDDQLLCEGAEIARRKTESTRTDLGVVGSVSEWKYSYQNGKFSLLETIPKRQIATGESSTGKNGCFSEPYFLFRKPVPTE
jgi:hypothetical protein